MTRKLSRREFFFRSLAGGAAFTLFGSRAYALPPTPMVVYMDPGCGCCSKWVGLMGAAGFQTSVQRTSDMGAIKKRYGIANNIASCHTALVGGYLVEGHVPADLIQKMLKDKPKILGLAVPGMVNGSPGMEGPTKDPYDVITFDAAGKTTVYAKR